MQIFQNLVISGDRERPGGREKGGLKGGTYPYPIGEYPLSRGLAILTSSLIP